jgi:hypothetical protein
MFDGHNARVGKQLFRVVVYELSVYEHGAIVFEYLFDFFFHLFLFGKLEFCYFGHRIDFDPRTEYLDLIRIHGRIGNEYSGVFNALRLIDADFLVQQKAFVQIGIMQTAAKLLDYLNCVEIATALKSCIRCIINCPTRHKLNVRRLTFKRRTASTARFEK